MMRAMASIAGLNVVISCLHLSSLALTNLSFSSKTKQAYRFQQPDFLRFLCC